MFTLIAVGKACYAKRKVAVLVLLFIVVDILFVAAYIAVAALTRGAVNGSSCRTINDEEDGDDGDDGDTGGGRSTNCNLEKGVFALSIINMWVFQ